MLMFLHVDSVEYVDGYRLQIAFDNGITKVVDLTAQLHGVMFEPLLDVTFFQQVKVDQETRTIQWPNGADFAPEFLFEIGEQDKVVA